MDIHFDSVLGTIARTGEEPIQLTRSERSALALLASNPDRLISRDRILDAVSEEGSGKSDRNVDFLINRLRRKLSDDARNPRYIATRYGEGYVWIAGAQVSLTAIAEAEAVVGPVRGLELLGAEDGGRAVSAIASALTKGFGDRMTVVYAPDCPPPEEFRGQAPRLSAEMTFFADRGRRDCVVAIREFRTGRVLFARRLSLAGPTPDATELSTLSVDVGSALWRAEVAALSHHEPMPLKLYLASGAGEYPERDDETMSQRKLMSRLEQHEARTLSRWKDNERHLRAELAAAPNDPELMLLLALNTHSKYISIGHRLFQSGDNAREADEDEIEAFVTAALPAIRVDPDHAIIAGKLLYFLRRGYDTLARDICEEAFAQSVTLGRSLPIVGQMRAYFGDTDAALQCLDQALNLAKPGSRAHLYSLFIKCQVLSAAGRWDALESARRELAGTSFLAGFFFSAHHSNPEAPSLRSRALAYLLGRDRAEAMLMHNYYVSARLFQDPAAGARSLRSLATVLSDRFGPGIVRDEVRQAFPDLLPR